MYNISTLKNGLTLITIPMPHLDSVTTLVAVGAGSRYETRQINGLSHFLEHMFFKGSKKYPSAEQIATMVDEMGAINNAATGKEYTFYWIKSASKNIELAMDILSSMLKESLLSEEEMEREKGVIVEELRMYRDMPQRFVFDLYEQLQFGDQPLGWDIGGDEKTVTSLKRKDFVDYMNSLYAPKNMAVVFAGKLPKNLPELVEQYFADLPKNSQFKSNPYKKIKQTKARARNFYKKTDQAQLVLGVEGYDRYSKKRHAAHILATILGEGMSSRLFIQVRERRGLAYHVSASHDSYMDTGSFQIYAGLKLEKAQEGLEIILAELQRVVGEKVTSDELKKAQEIIRGRIAIRSESTNFLAEHFGTDFVLDHELTPFEEELKNIEAVTAEDVQAIAKELFVPTRYNLQMIAPFKSIAAYQKLLK